MNSRHPPGPGDTPVKVHAAGLNPVDCKLRQGKLRLLNRLGLPLAAGSELADVVETAGSGVTRFVAGNRGFARVDKRKLSAFAESAAVTAVMTAPWI